MSYQVQYLRTGIAIEKSDLFQTFHQAESFAAKQLGRREPKPEVIAIVEIDDDGNQGRIHKLQVF